MYRSQFANQNTYIHKFVSLNLQNILLEVGSLGQMASVYVVSRFPTRRIAIACIPTSNVEECLFLYIIHQKCDHFQFLSIWYVKNGVSITSWFAFFNCEFEWLFICFRTILFPFLCELSIHEFSHVFIICPLFPILFLWNILQGFSPFATALWLSL